MALETQRPPPTYYNNAITTDEAFFNASQAGAVFVFEALNDSKWSKFAVGFNYRITKDFCNHGFSAGGNSGIATFTDFPIDQNTPRLVYDISEEQRFRSTMNGELSEINIAFSSVHENKLYAGVGLNFYDLNFNQETLLTEFNNTADDQELDVDLYQVNNTIGTGFSLNCRVYFIKRINSSDWVWPTKRQLGFQKSYKTPTMDSTARTILTLVFSKVRPPSLQRTNHPIHGSIMIGSTLPTD